MDRKRPTKKPESQHLHKTREYRLPLIIYDILRNGETTGRRLEKTRYTGRGVANSGPLAQFKIHLISIQCESKSQKTMRRSVLRISLFIFRTISILDKAETEADRYVVRTNLHFINLTFEFGLPRTQAEHRSVYTGS